MLRALGAEVVLVPQVGGPRPGKVTKEDLALVEQRAIELTAELDALRPDQFHNPSNTRAMAGKKRVNDFDVRALPASALVVISEFIVPFSLVNLPQ